MAFRLLIEARANFQSGVRRWIIKCLGREKAFDPVERNERFLEEALELVQSLGMRESEAMRVVLYVYHRPIGSPAQEVGGVMTTLAALCNCHGLKMEKLGDAALEENWKRIDVIRKKNAAKPKFADRLVPPGQL